MSKTIYSIKKIKKCFGQRKIIDEVSYDFLGGHSYAILGESGSGKTTLLNILGLLDNKYHGSIFIDNSEIEKKYDNYLMRNKKIGFIFQSYYLIDYLNVKDNILMPLEYTEALFDKEYYEYLLDALNIRSIEESKVNYLSGGEKQRVAIARALINRPEIIICDEPTGNLDDKNSNQVISMLGSLISEDKVLIIVTHNCDVAQACDIVLNLEKGKLYEIEK